VRLGFLILLYTFFRILFYIANAGSFPNAKLAFFFYGIRFDISAIFYTNAPYMLAILLPFSFCYKKIYRKITNGYFIFLNGFAVVCSFVDVAYYPYVLKRTTVDIFSYLHVAFDFQTLAPTFLKQYWYLLLIFLATLLVIIYVVRITDRMMVKNIVFHVFSWKELLLKILLLLLMIFISAICQRGGFQTRPLGLIDTGKDATIQYASLVSNTPFTLVHSFGRQQYEAINYFQDLDEAERYYSPFIRNIVPCSNYCYPVKNVILIILESFSPYLIFDPETNKNNVDYQGYCPFLNALQQQSLSFNGIANGKRTIESLPAIFGGIPVLIDRSYVESTFANNLTCSPVEALKNHGYHTLFFHGAKNGSMNIESYCYSIGFNEYYGKNEYPNPADDDGVWGISDRPYLQYVAQTLDRVRQPFLAGVLTLSSHHPYEIPKDAENLTIKKGTHPIHAVASYTDYAVKDFFETLKKYSWYDSTLFIITGDHTGTGAVPEPSSRYTQYQVPLFFYHPQINMSKNLGMMQQLDIMPTLFSYLNINEPLFSYGNNIFDSTYNSCSVNYLSGIYQLTSPNFILQFDGEKSVGFYDSKNDILMQNNLVNEKPEQVFFYEQKIKAIIQSYTTRMVKNQLFINNKQGSVHKP
jgi:phosphoglycerol transferase MdoB-like AlkP superfamily enzyme